MKHVVLNLFTITKLAKCKQFQLVFIKDYGGGKQKHYWYNLSGLCNNLYYVRRSE